MNIAIDGPAGAGNHRQISGTSGVIFVGGHIRYTQIGIMDNA